MRSLEPPGDEIAGVIAELEKAGLEVHPVQADAFRTYLAEVRAWGRKINLVSPRDLDRLGSRHLLESFNALHYPGPVAGMRAVDVGSGAGFPGLPLAIWQSDLQLLLVESVRKKAQFLAHVINKLRISDRVGVICGRAEEIAVLDAHRQRYDLVTARGVGSLERVVGWVTPFLRPGGRLIAFKGTRIESELVRATSAMSRLDVHLVDVVSMRWGQGNIVVLRRGEAAEDRG